jgi:hypothetical protein
MSDEPGKRWLPPPLQPEPPSGAVGGRPGWAPPQPGFPAPQQSPGQRGPRRRRRWSTPVGIALVVALGVGVLFALYLVKRPAPSPTAGSTAMPLVTVAPASQPAEQTVLTSGGDLGVAASFSAGTGTGTLTITRATWTHAGRMAPPVGKLYLIVEATIACADGTFDVSSLSLRTTSDPADQSAFGADLPDQFPGVRLAAGQQQSGQVGFVLAAGQVTVALLDQTTLQPVAERVVPGP